MKAPLARIEIWSNLRCIAASKRLAMVQEPSAVEQTKRLRGDGSIGWVMAQSDASAAEILEDRAALLVFADDTVEEYRITGKTAVSAESGDTYRVRALPILFDLDGAGVITAHDAQGVPSFAGSRYQITAAELINTVILPYLASVGFTWVALGTDETTTTFDIEWSDLTPLGLLHRIEEKTGAELEFPPNGSTEYVINLRAAVGAAHPIADLRKGKNLRDSEVDHDSTARLSDCTGIGAADPAGRPAVIGRAVWRVSAANLGTNRLTIEDPEGGPDPILEDDQLNGLYVYLYAGTWQSGTTDQILDTVGQEIEVADASLYAVGDLIEIRADVGTSPAEDDAPLITTLRRPSVVVRRFGKVNRPDLAGERNLLGNGYLTEFVNGTDAPPAGVTLSNAVTPRDLQSTDPVDATLGGSALSLRFKYSVQLSADAASGQPTVQVPDTTGVEDGMSLWVGSTAGEQLVVLSHTATTITFTTNLANSYVAAAGARVFEDGAESALLFIQNYGYCVGERATWQAIRAPSQGGRLYFVQVKYTLRNAHTQGLSVVQLVARTQSRVAMWSTKTTEQANVIGVPIEADVGETIEVELTHYIDTLLQATTTVPSYVHPVMPTNNRLIVDGIAVTQTDYWPTKIPHYSNANALWHAVQRALAVGSLAATTWRLGLVDLTALDAAGWPDDELLLGATVRVNHGGIEATNEMLRIGEIHRPDLFVPAEVLVTLEQRRPPMSELMERTDELGGSSGTGGDSNTPGAGSPAIPGVTPPGANPLPPGQTPSAGLIEVPAVLPFFAGAQAGTRVTLTNQPSVLQEIDTGQRLFVDLARCTRLMLMRHCETPGATSAYAAIQYSLDKGLTWAGYLDGALGPWVLLDSTLEPDDHGNAVVPVNAARTLVLLRVVTLNGDGAADPVLGNYFLHAWFAANLAAFPINVRPPLPPGAGCHLIGTGSQKTDWSQFATIQDLYNFAQGISVPHIPLYLTTWYNGFVVGNYEQFDSTVLWAGHKTLKVRYDASGSGGGWDTVPSNGGVPGHNEQVQWPADFWRKSRISMDASFPTPSGEMILHEVAIRGSGNVYGMYYDEPNDEVFLRKGSGARTVLGGKALFEGAGFVEFGFHYVEAAGAVTVDFYLHAPCASTPTKVGTLNGTLSSPIPHNVTDYIAFLNPTFSLSGAARHLWIGDDEFAVSTPANPSPFGWTP